MKTKIKNASVKVMLSYDYSHFEASMSLENEGGLSMAEIDTARKNCQRLAENMTMMMMMITTLFNY